MLLYYNINIISDRLSNTKDKHNKVIGTITDVNTTYDEIILPFNIILSKPAKNYTVSYSFNNDYYNINSKIDSLNGCYDNIKLGNDCIVGYSTSNPSDATVLNQNNIIIPLIVTVLFSIFIISGIVVFISILLSKE